MISHFEGCAMLAQVVCMPNGIPKHTIMHHYHCMNFMNFMTKYTLLEVIHSVLR